MRNQAEIITVVPIPGEVPIQERPQAPAVKRNIAKPKKKKMMFPADLTQALELLVPLEHLPELMAKGGEHLVFTFEEEKPGTGEKRHPNIVYKVNFAQTADALKEFIADAGHQPEEDRLRQAEQRLKQEVGTRRRNVQQLRSYFGKDAVPAEQTMVRRLPISFEAVRALKKPIVAPKKNLPPEFPMLVTVQRKMPEFDAKISLSGYYLEMNFRLDEDRDENKEYFRRQKQFYALCYLVFVEQRLPKDAEEWTGADLDRLIAQMYPELQGLMQKDDPALLDELADLVERMRRYSEETGNVLDLAAPGNVLLTEKDERWRPMMPDAILPNECTFDEARLYANYFKRLPPDKHLDYRTVIVLMNALNTVRVINALMLIALQRDPDKPAPDLKTIPFLHFEEFDNLDLDRWIKELAYHNVF